MKAGVSDQTNAGPEVGATGEFLQQSPSEEAGPRATRKTGDMENTALGVRGGLGCAMDEASERIFAAVCVLFCGILNDETLLTNWTDGRTRKVS